MNRRNKDIQQSNSLAKWVTRKDGNTAEVIYITCETFTIYYACCSVATCKAIFYTTYTTVC